MCSARSDGEARVEHGLISGVLGLWAARRVVASEWFAGGVVVVVEATRDSEEPKP
ncbi:hypothetical protein Dimus_031609, partial [Dionaea muscipula]